MRSSSRFRVDESRQPLIEEGTFHSGERTRIPRQERLEGHRVEVHLLPSREAPGGRGELGYPSVAPAIANTVFAATGGRVRHQPIRPEDVR